jgi:hypothetical protein
MMIMMIIITIILNNTTVRYVHTIHYTYFSRCNHVPCRTMTLENLKQTVPLKMCSCRSKHVAELSNYFPVHVCAVHVQGNHFKVVQEPRAPSQSTRINTLQTAQCYLTKATHSEDFPLWQRDAGQPVFQSASP